MADERVKPCPRCDGLVPFADSHCPHCGAFGSDASVPSEASEAAPVTPPSVPFLAESIVVGVGAALAAGTFVALGF